MKNIFLIGFMGSGKSRLAEAAAKALNRPLIECDRAIEESEKMTVAEIFSLRGEKYFRQKETELLQNLKPSAGAIVSCGGGMAMRRENTDLMRRSGGIVFLDAPFDLCYARISDDPRRPVAAARGKEELLELYKVRRMIYLLEADEVVDASKEIEEKVEIIKKIKEINRW